MLTKGPPVIAEFAKGDRVYVHSADEARATVRELAALKPDVIKHHNVLKRDIFFAVIDEAKKAGLRVSGHFPMGEKITLREVAEAGQATIEHLGWPGVSADFKAMTPAGQDSLVGIVKKSGLGFVPTLVVGDFSKESAAGSDSARLDRAHQDPRARLVTPQLWAAWDGMIKVLAQYRKAGGASQYDFPGEVAMLRRFHKAGVPILPGTDFTVQFLFPGSSAQEEVAELVKQVGMTPNEAIQAASRRSAEISGSGRRRERSRRASRRIYSWSTRIHWWTSPIPSGWSGSRGKDGSSIAPRSIPCSTMPRASSRSRPAAADPCCRFDADGASLG